MDEEKQDPGFVEKEQVKTVPTRKGEELHFTVVEVDGEIRGDVRFFTWNKELKKMTASKRGIAVLPRHFKTLKDGVSELSEKLDSFSRKE